MRGKGWGRKHSTVDYVFTHDPAYLIAYHLLVMDEMKKRGYNPDKIWLCQDYRGKELGYQKDWTDFELAYNLYKNNNPIYPEHNDEYLKECLENLKNKGITIKEFNKNDSR